jgi:hypothetical protein
MDSPMGFHGLLSSPEERTGSTWDVAIGILSRDCPLIKNEVSAFALLRLTFRGLGSKRAYPSIALSQSCQKIIR